MVDSAETARGCVTFLREKAHGVATFLILDAQKGLRTEASSQPPEGEQASPRTTAVLENAGNDKAPRDKEQSCSH